MAPLVDYNNQRTDHLSQGFVTALHTTTEAHQTFNTPTVNMALVLLSPSGGLYFIRPSDDGAPVVYPAIAALNHLQSADILSAMAGLSTPPLDREFHLISSLPGAQNEYSYNFLCVARVSEATIAAAQRLVSFDDYSSSVPDDQQHPLFSFIARHGIRDNLLTSPPNAIDAPDPLRREATRRLHETTLCNPLITVGAILVVTDDQDSRRGVILARRSSSLSREPGLWHLPSGFVESHETAAQSLRREISEELGLSLDNTSVKRHLLSLTPSSRELKWINWPQLYEVHTKLHPQLFWSGPTAEVSEVKLFTRSTLPAPREFAFDEGLAIRSAIEMAL